MNLLPNCAVSYTWIEVLHLLLQIQMFFTIAFDNSLSYSSAGPSRSCSPTIYFLELQNQLAKLKSGSLRRSGLYFNATQSTEVGMMDRLKTSYITSTFPFNNVISRNLSDISLCTLLERSLVLSDKVNDEDDP